MKKTVLFLLLILVGTSSCDTQLKKEDSKKTSLAEFHKEKENQIRQAIQGVPFVIPLPEESDPGLFLMPASNSNDSLKVDRLYLIDGTRDDFVFERDIYEIKCIERTNVAEDSTYKNKALVLNVRYKTPHLFEIDGLMYHQIMKINKGEWDYPTAIKIPAVLRSATTNEVKEASEIILK